MSTLEARFLTLLAVTPSPQKCLVIQNTRSGALSPRVAVCLASTARPCSPHPRSHPAAALSPPRRSLPTAADLAAPCLDESARLAVLPALFTAVLSTTALATLRRQRLKECGLGFASTLLNRRRSALAPGTPPSDSASSSVLSSLSDAESRAWKVWADTPPPALHTR